MLVDASTILNLTGLVATGIGAVVAACSAMPSDDEIDAECNPTWSADSDFG